MVKNLLIVSLMAFSLLLGACDVGPNPREILNKSHDAMREVQSYRFSGEIEMKTPDGVIGGRQSGEWAAPDQLYLKLEPLGEFAGQVLETVVIDRRLFTREPASSEGEEAWQEMIPFPEGFAAFNPRPESYLAIADLENLELRDNVAVNGTATFQITGERKEIRTLPERFPERPEGDEVKYITRYTWLIAKEDYRLVRYIAQQTIGPATHGTTMEFYDYNQPVTIAMPEITVE